MSEHLTVSPEQYRDARTGPGSTEAYCARVGHHFVPNRDQSAFVCSHGCGKRVLRNQHTTTQPEA